MKCLPTALSLLVPSSGVCLAQFLEMGVEQHYGFTKTIRARSAANLQDASYTAEAVGAATELQADVTKWPATGNKVHTLCTSNGSPYTNFQNRIMYATYKLSQQMPGGDVLAGFTRILHRTVPDEVMKVNLPVVS